MCLYPRLLCSFLACRYYTLSAACALFKFVETRLNTRFSACSLRIRYIPVEGTMMIDPETVRNLELINNQTRKKSTHSLFGYLASFLRLVVV
jgi:DNA mismatch repair protein MSH4